MSEMKEQVAAKTSIKNIKKVNKIKNFKALFLLVFGGECMMIGYQVIDRNSALTPCM